MSDHGPIFYKFALLLLFCQKDLSYKAARAKLSLSPQVLDGADRVLIELHCP
jgi:hypothetical protein